MMNENKTALVCLRCDDKPRSLTKRCKHIPESVVSRCEECDAPVWISPASTEAQIEHNPVILCPLCGEKNSNGRPAELQRFGNEIMVIPLATEGSQ